MKDAIREAVSEGRMGDRLWLYATYHCNLACVYCLTESSPRIANRRTLDADTMVRATREAKELGFTCVGITGGEVFARGLRVRIATTVADQEAAELERVCALHRRLGIPDEEHVVRTVVRRGRAVTTGMGIELGPTDVLPELTLTADGAFLHPFAPTVLHGRTDLDLLVSRQIAPLEAPARRFLSVVREQPVGDDVVRSIR